MEPSENKPSLQEPIKLEKENIRNQKPTRINSKNLKPIGSAQNIESKKQVAPQEGTTLGIRHSFQRSLSKLYLNETRERVIFYNNIGIS